MKLLLVEDNPEPWLKSQPGCSRTSSATDCPWLSPGQY